MAIGRRFLTAALVLSAGAGCAGAGGPGATSAAAPRAGAGSSSSRSSGADTREAQATVTLRPDARKGLVHVAVTVRDEAPGTWALGGVDSKALHAVAARDARGAVEVTVGADSLSLTAKGRALEAPLELGYDVSPAAAAPDPHEACALEVTPDRATFCGSSVLLSPAQGAATRRHFRVVSEADKEFYKDAGSSFSTERDAVLDASFAELGRAVFVFGSVGHATFAAPEGRDHAAWSGFFSFDPRWASAEAAGIRTMTDRWMKVERGEDDPSVGVVFAPVAGHERVFDIRPVYRGALVRADVGAPWGARARVEMTRLFVQRTIGRQISIAAGEAAGPSTTWFDDGLSHAIALEVLRDAGILSHGELAAEANALLAEEALSPLRGRSVVELGTLERTSKNAPERKEAARVLAVRGALMGVALGEASNPVLSKLVRGLVERAQDKHSSFGADEVFGAAAKLDTTGRAEAVIAAFRRGEPIPLRAVDLDACDKIVERTIYAFELGFETTRGDAEGSTKIGSVAKGSAAAKAGVRAGDSVVSMDYVPNHADTPVRLVVQRDDRPVEIRYQPRGEGKPGKVFSVTKSAMCAD